MNHRVGDGTDGGGSSSASGTRVGKKIHSELPSILPHSKERDLLSALPSSNLENSSKIQFSSIPLVHSKQSDPSDQNKNFEDFLTHHGVMDVRTFL